MAEHELPKLGMRVRFPSPAPGPTLVIIGAIVLVIGLLAWIAAMSWFGRQPGDPRFGGGNVRVYVPITSMVLVSVV